MIQEWNGRWRAGDCTTLLRVACRHVDDTSKVSGPRPFSPIYAYTYIWA